ncbi:MAG: phospholipase D family protein [Acidimicrobiales bacterium]
MTSGDPDRFTAGPDSRSCRPAYQPTQPTLRAGPDTGHTGGVDSSPSCQSPAPDWLLEEGERGNPGSGIDRRQPDGRAWTGGNQVVVHVDGALYFRRLLEVAEGLGRGDTISLTDWRGDPDERLDGPGTEIAEVLCRAARRGAAVRGLVWRSHLDRFRFSAGENRHLEEEVNAAGGELLLDQRVRFGGSHHQKLVVVRRAGGEDVAFVGGIDLCHSRRDDADHAGDPQAQPMAVVYGPAPPWHDIQMEVHGPAVGALDATFRERWGDPAPLSRNPFALAADLVRGDDRRASRLPPAPPDPPSCGPHAVQVLRTYPNRHPGYPFAPRGERSVARAYVKALGRARRLVYVEDQYLWSAEVARVFAEALRREPALRLVAVVPRYPDRTGRLATPLAVVGRNRAIGLLRAAAGDRVAVYDAENRAGTPIYVHAKVCVVDDVWASVGSDNVNRRSWSHDSELSCAVLDETRDGRAPADPGGLGDGARVFARGLRLRLWREHLGRAEGDDADLLDPETGAAAFARAAAALDRWHAAGREGQRPPGHVRPHAVTTLSGLQRAWATPLYRLACDPDGRPLPLRVRGRW